MNQLFSYGENYVDDDESVNSEEDYTSLEDDTDNHVTYLTKKRFSKYFPTVSTFLNDFVIVGKVALLMITFLLMTHLISNTKEPTGSTNFSLMSQDSS